MLRVEALSNISKLFECHAAQLRGDSCVSTFLLYTGAFFTEKTEHGLVHRSISMLTGNEYVPMVSITLDSQ